MFKISPATQAERSRRENSPQPNDMTEGHLRQVDEPNTLNYAHSNISAEKRTKENSSRTVKEETKISKRGRAVAKSIRRSEEVAEEEALTPAALAYSQSSICFWNFPTSQNFLINTSSLPSRPQFLVPINSPSKHAHLILQLPQPLKNGKPISREPNVIQQSSRKLTTSAYSPPSSNPSAPSRPCSIACLFSASSLRRRPLVAFSCPKAQSRT